MTVDRGLAAAGRLGYPLLLLLILIAFYWKITLTYQYDWMSGPELAQQVLPWFEEEARQMRHHHFPVWDPHTWAGQPLLAQARTGAAYPLNWLLFLAPTNRGHIDTLALQWYFIAMHYMAALFCYLLCRDLGLTRFAALIGGLIFSLGAFMGTIHLPRILNAAVWAPLVFLFLLRAVRAARPIPSAALCGVFWGMSWLSGDLEVPLLISLAAILTWLYYILRGRSFQLVGPALLAVMFMFFTGALQILPSGQYGRVAAGLNRSVPYTVQETFSIPPLTVLGIVIPGVTNGAGPFIGVVALVLSSTAIMTAWGRSEVKLFAALTAGGFAYAMGFHNVFQGILYAVVPFAGKTRAPAVAIVLFGFGAAVLAAFGIDQMMAMRQSVLVRRIGWSVAGFGLLIWAVAYCVLLAKALNWSGDDRVIMTGLLAFLAAGLLFAWTGGNLTNRAAAVILTGLMLIELGNVAGADFADRNDFSHSYWLQAIRSNKDAADFLTRQPQPVRVDVAADEHELPANWPEYYNIDQVQGPAPAPWTPVDKSLYGVQFTVGRNATMPETTVVFEIPNGIKVFQNPHALPRAWAVHELILAPKSSDAAKLVQEHFNELRAKAFVSESPATPLETCPATDAVMVTRHDPAHVTIRATMACGGMVVLSDSFYPGWQATVDKKSVAISDVNFGMRGVPVPRGTHEINYIYRSSTVFAGGAMSASGVLASCLLVFFDRKRRRAIDLEPKRANNQS